MLYCSHLLKESLSSSESQKRLGLVIEAAHGVAVTRILDSIYSEAVKHFCVVFDNLEALLEEGRLPFDIAAADQENLVARSFYVGKVVLKSRLHVNLSLEDLLDSKFVFVDVL